MAGPAIRSQRCSRMPKRKPQRVPEDVTITWHPYPEEAPPKGGGYLVTTISEMEPVMEAIWHPEGRCSLTGAVYDQARWIIRLQPGKKLKNQGVTAWAEEPKPYGKEDAPQGLADAAMYEIVHNVKFSG